MSTKDSGTSLTPYHITNAAMHSAVHVALPSNSNLHINATALAAYEAAAAAAIVRSVAAEAASLAAAAAIGVVGFAGVTPAKGVNSTAGSQQMLVNITLSLSVTVPSNVNDTLLLVDGPANAGATAEANMTSEIPGEADCWTNIGHVPASTLTAGSERGEAPGVVCAAGRGVCTQLKEAYADVQHGLSASQPASQPVRAVIVPMLCMLTTRSDCKTHLGTNPPRQHWCNLHNLHYHHADISFCLLAVCAAPQNPCCQPLTTHPLMTHPPRQQPLSRLT
jgi:hypothetical protein